MIKINLLPKSINEARAIKTTAMIFGFILIVVVAGGLTYAGKLKATVEAKGLEAATAEQWKSQTDALDKQAKDLEASIGPMKQKLDFITAVLDFNTKYPELYEEVARWTYDKVQYTTMQCNGTDLVMSARAKGLDDVGRYLLNMYQATDMFTQVTISQVPGYRAAGNQQGLNSFGGQIGGSFADLAGLDAIQSGLINQKEDRYKDWINFTVTCKLKKPIAAPAFAGAAAAGGAPADPNAGMAPPAMPGPGNPSGAPMPMD